jgi:hypothetical protein
MVRTSLFREKVCRLCQAKLEMQRTPAPSCYKRDREPYEITLVLGPAWC